MTEVIQQDVRTGVEAAEKIARHLWTMPVLASDALGWQGLIARRYLNVQPAYVEIPPLDDNILVITLRGASRIDGRMARRFSGEIAAPGSSFLAPCGIASQWYNSHAIDILHLYVPPLTLTRLITDSGGYTAEPIELRPLCSHADPLLEQLAYGLLHEMSSVQLQGQLYANTLIQAIAAHLLRHYSSATPQTQAQIEPRRTSLTPVRLRQVFDYIQEHLEQDLSLAHLATIAHLSPYHLTRLFKEATGLSLHQYVTHQRVERAKQFLQESDLRIADIAAQVGFHDHAHLIRHFTRLVGISPGNLRKIVHGGRKDVQGSNSSKD